MISLVVQWYNGGHHSRISVVYSSTLYSAVERRVWQCRAVEPDSPDQVVRVVVLVLVVVVSSESQ